MRKSLIILALLFAGLSVYAQEDANLRYYAPRDSVYTFGDFFDALDLPVFLGVGLNPAGIEELTFYNVLEIEWRQRKTYGWFGFVELDTHDHDYKETYIPAYKNHPAINAQQGVIFSMDAMGGVGYKIPLVKDIRGFYQKPYEQALNLGLQASLGAGMSHAKNVELVTGAQSIINGEQQYNLVDVWYYYPVMKFAATLEWLLDPQLCIFFSASYLQHLQPQPWDPTTKVGPLGFCIGLSTFFK